MKKSEVSFLPPIIQPVEFGGSYPYLNEWSEDVIKLWQEDGNQNLDRDCDALDEAIDDLIQKSFELCDFYGKTSEGKETKALEIFDQVRSLNNIKMKIKRFRAISVME